MKWSHRPHNYRTGNCTIWVGHEGLSSIADVKCSVHQTNSLDNLPLWSKTEHWKVEVHTDLSCEVIFIDSMFKWYVQALKATFFAIFICGQHRKLLWALYLRTFEDQRTGNCLSAIVTETLSLWNQKEVVCVLFSLFVFLKLSTKKLDVNGAVYIWKRKKRVGLPVNIAFLPTGDCGDVIRLGNANEIWIVSRLWYTLTTVAEGGRQTLLRTGWRLQICYCSQYTLSTRL